MYKIFFMTIVSFVLNANLALAQEATDCATAMRQVSHPPLSISVGTAFPDPIVDRSLSLSEIGSSSGVETAPGFHTLAYVKKRPYWKMNATTASIKLADGTFCSWPSGISVLIGFYAPRIYINRNSVVGSCTDNVIVWHENQHVKNSIVALEAMVGRTEISLANLQQMPPASSPNLEEAREKALSAVKPIMEQEMAIASREAASNDAQLDTLQNYMHQFDSCQKSK